jgi:4-azaleucine resistance transporter AzlC
MEPKPDSDSDSDSRPAPSSASSPSSPGARADAIAGARDVSPVVLGNLPYGIVTGIAMLEAGFSEVQALLLSGLVFGGASQLAAADLVVAGAPLAVVVLTGLVVNARLMMYSASLAPHFRDLSGPWRAGLAAFLTDPVYAVSVNAAGERRALRWYFIGAVAPVWGSWVVGTAVGVLVGRSVPPGWRLDFAVPLVFLALVVPAIEDRSTAVAAIVAGAAAVLGQGLPYQTGLLAAAGLGIAAGRLAEVAR